MTVTDIPARATPSELKTDTYDMHGQGRRRKREISRERERKPIEGDGRLIRDDKDSPQAETEDSTTGCRGKGALK